MVVCGVSFVEDLQYLMVEDRKLKCLGILEYKDKIVKFIRRRWLLNPEVCVLEQVYKYLVAKVLLSNTMFFK